MEIFFLLGLILLNGVFAMSEIALVTARRARLKKLAAEGDTSAAVALQLGEDPTRFLSTVQIGITSIGILNGIVGESVFAAPLSKWLLSVGVPEKPAEIGATVLVVVVVTYFSIVIGELVPKRLGQINPEPIARLVARPMQLLALITRPFVRLLTFSTKTILSLMGVKQDTAAGVTEEEIHALLEEGSESGVIEHNQHEMVKNLFRLDDRQLGSLMIPRAEVVFLDVSEPLDENLRRVTESERSRFPVCRGGFEEVLGVLHSKQVLAAALKGQKPDLLHNLQPCVFVPETLTGMELLENFRDHHMSMAFVIDEHGEVEGIVTLHDLLEAVTGEFQPRNAADSWAVQRDDGTWLLDGSIPLPDLKDRLELKTLPEEDKGRYQMLSGLVMLLLGRVPKTGDHADWAGWRLEVVDMDNMRIDKVLASPLPAEAGSTPSADKPVTP